MVDYRDVLQALEKVGKGDFVELSAEFGLRFDKAWEILTENRVKLYVFWPSGRVMWIVVGRGFDYIVYDQAGYCSCDDFFHAVMDRRARACQHLIAQRLAQILRDYDVIEEDDGLFGALMSDWRLSL